MQRTTDGDLVVSATDLVGFLSCDHLTTLELGALAALWPRPHRREDPEVRLLQERGEAHEQAYLERLRGEGRSVVEIARPEPGSADAYRAAEATTLEAMRAGVGAIFQATLFDGRWLGYADFLLRVERPSPALGAWSYEVADTKLARSVKAAAILQVCSYSARLGELQGLVPAAAHVVTGDGRSHPLPLHDFDAYFRMVRRRFESVVFGDGAGEPRDPATAGTYPDPVDHCRVCAWFPVCIDRRRSDDHLSLVAGMTRAQTGALVAAGIPTLAGLGRLDRTREVPELDVRTLERLREQARLQLEGREAGRTELDPLWERIPPRAEEPGRGLAALPAASPLDLFFDIEADPWLDDGGREYLLGLLSIEGGSPRYRPLWAHAAGEERAAFEALIDDIIDRLDRDPAMHVYHYGGYESGAIKRLMQRHTTREDEVDRLLRGGVLVDLYGVVRQGIRASVESYSLKQVEHLFGFDREGRVTRAGFSVVEYEDWLHDGEQRHLDDLAAYNRDDCMATLGLRDWLEARRSEAIADGWDLPRPPLRDGAPTEAQEARDRETLARVEALRAGVPEDPAERTSEQAAHWLLAALLDYHRREAKPEWWRWFDLRDRSSADDLVEASDAIGDLAFVGDVGLDKRSVLQRFAFPPQDHRFRPGDRAADPRTGSDTTIAQIDDAAGWLVLRRGPAVVGDHPNALIPASPIPTDAQRGALLRLADDVIARGIDATGPWRAARDLLLRRAPRVGSEPLEVSGETGVEAARRLIRALDHSVLAIQGPPGTGKTYAGARMVLEALASGRGPVAITSQSHRAIVNFLEKLHEAAEEAGTTVRVLQKADEDDGAHHLAGVEVTSDNATVAARLAEETVDVVAGTSWLLARPELTGRFGCLVVDEAGQLALATVLAMAGATDSIVLLGDPNQLAQVTQGLHPEGAGASALGHVLGEATTLPADQGLFLDTTRRLHPAVNAFTSPTFYDGRLDTHPTTAVQRVVAPGGLDGVGLRWRPVDHRRNAQRSGEEADAVARIVVALIGETWVDASGTERRITLDDLLVVAPYNAQVALVQQAIEARLGPVTPGRVGTVDKFQGREGAVAIYTMAASSAEDAPRGMDFLYDAHRLNVATSRARAMAIVVASPTLLEVRARTPGQMRLANTLVRFVELAGEQEPGRSLQRVG
ncbi:MAG TPA: TM0106 family RecB-like putative nuclease [Candidatus Limnocylindrales bacterium]|nr:TM0106 family RecB-like putative nuclease [Candidatus Limnocylindrales bacterium]